MAPKVVYHARFYEYNSGTKDIMKDNLPSAKSWAENKMDSGLLMWNEYGGDASKGVWKGYSHDGPQKAEIHKRKIGVEFDRF